MSQEIEDYYEEARLVIAAGLKATGNLPATAEAFEEVDDELGPIEDAAVLAVEKLLFEADKE